MATPYRYTTPVPKKTATGQVAAVYEQIAADFILADGPLMSLSPAPDLLAAAWALLREAELAGQASRVDKEVVATAIALANRCTFCRDAHASLIHAAGAHQLAETVWRGETPDDPAHARLVAWARATAAPDTAELAAPPFPTELAAEYLGTALSTHFIGRMVSSLLNERFLAGRLQSSQLFRRVAGRTLVRVVSREPDSGQSLRLLADIPAEEPPEWAGESPIGAAYAALASAAAGGGRLLSPPAQTRVLTAVARWDGTPPEAGGWLEEELANLAVADRPGVRLALLAATAPGRITDDDVAAWRAVRPADADLIRLLAFGAMTAVHRIEAWATVAWRPMRSPAAA